MNSFWVAAALAAALNQSPPALTHASTAHLQAPAPPITASPAQPLTSSPPNPFKALFPNLGRDVRSMASVNSIIVMSVGGAGAVATKNNADLRAHDWAVKQPADPGLAKFGNVAGDGFLQGGLAVATWAIGRQQKSVRLETTGSDLIRAQVLNGVLTQAIKLTVNRERPDGGGHAFPSGHASATFATAAVIQRDYGFAAALPFYGLGGLVSWSRVRTSHHWVSDVVFGGALGITSGLAVTKGRTGKWWVTPVKTSGGAAIFVTRR